MGPRRYMVHTWGQKGFSYTYFKGPSISYYRYMDPFGITTQNSRRTVLCMTRPGGKAQAAAIVRMFPTPLCYFFFGGTFVRFRVWDFGLKLRELPFSADPCLWFPTCAGYHTLVGTCSEAGMTRKPVWSAPIIP